jgi:hypothetical protein
MKTILTERDFINGFKNNQFSVQARIELFKWLSDYEVEAEVELEYNPVALSCEWTEYEDEKELFEAYGRDVKDDTTVIEFSGGFLVQNF